VRLVRQTLRLWANDLRQEARERELVATAGFFSLVVVVLFALAFDALPESSHPKAVPGMLWLAVAFVGTLTLTRVFDREREADTLVALLAAPVERLAIYFAKLLTVLVVIGACGLVLVPGLAFVFPGASGLVERPLLAAAVFLCGSVGYAGLATSGGKNVLLSVVLHPLSTPILLLSLVATQRVLEGHPGATQTLFQLALVDAALLSVGALLFESVLVGASGAGRTASNHGRRAQGSRAAPPEGPRAASDPSSSLEPKPGPRAGPLAGPLPGPAANAAPTVGLIAGRTADPSTQEPS
jgi:heme exporter protein B